MDVVSWLLAKRYTNNVIDKQKKTINSMANLGVKNFIPISPNKIHTTDTVEGISYYFNTNGSISVSGTASENGSGIIIGDTVRLSKDTYKITTGQEVEENSHICVYVIDWWTGEIYGISRENEGIFTIDENNENHPLVFVISVDENLTYDSVIIYPMCRLAEITDDTYVPYGKTNAELTQITENLKQTTPSNIQYLYDEEDISVSLDITKYDRVVSLNCSIIPHKEGNFIIASNLPYSAISPVYGVGRHTYDSPTKMSPNEFWLSGDTLYINVHENGISSCIFSLLYLSNY